MKTLLHLVIAALALSAFSGRAYALDSSALQQLALGDFSAKIRAIDELAQSGDESALKVLTALRDGNLGTVGSSTVVISAGADVFDAETGHPILPAPPSIDSVVISNRVRSRLDSAIAILQLSSTDTATRLAAATKLQDHVDDSLLPAILAAAARETNSKVRAALAVAEALIDLKSPKAAVRLAAVKALALSTRTETQAMLAAMLAKGDDGNYVEPDAQVRAEIAATLAGIRQRLELAQYADTFFTGLSLGSVLLLAALGLAITFGLLGIINMAHGELLMIGAYSTYVVQSLFRHYLPQYFDWYLAAAVPAAFLTSALVGIVLERVVIRHLYGRPLETLLATWGISLFLIQLVRAIFGAQNVDVANPAWMSGGLHAMNGLVLPYNRIGIIVFALFVLLLVWAILSLTRLGLHVRAVTQNRIMADCLGVRTPLVDMLAFAVGAGIAGLGGVALSQIGNVGPELGQGYIVDAFMVVVLGGVGQISGTVIAAFGLGEINKILEPVAGAVLGKFFVLLIIILFIQKRPQGLFALKGRAAEG
ncbi:MAG: urea ABC transporter permease subunit UrtB [Acidiferrobacterales bacterium]